MLAEDIRHPERQPIVFERRWDKIYKRKRETNEVGTEICPGTGVLKEEKFRNTGKHSHWQVSVEVWNLRE